ncbi:hypothetical protein DFH08DRAFT_463335 [Mycena albidolilacea]|uniref:Uncharacterized protein n=1 Tax=Mycena albidolilacea TaxID=1033008 RepID=A0AAD7EWY5_9AGAR|nr:hypothetical protein DFH08DRAFT_463335 [Mycena albidolilacea]
MRCLWLATVLSLSGFLELASAIIVSTMVDDNQPDGFNITYHPEGAWQQGGIGGCDGCPPPPITGLASMNTFHGSLFNQENTRSTHQVPPTATLVFFGSSVSVSCILSNGLSNPSGHSEMTFTIDGIQRDNFVYTPSGSPGFLPNKNVFASGSLELANHTLVIKNGGISGGSSLVILDYIT